MIAAFGSRDGNGSPDVALPTARAARSEADAAKRAHLEIVALYCQTDGLDLAAMIHYSDTRRR
jgi:hypothetical protein